MRKLMDGSRLEILRIINEHPNCTVNDIAEALGLAPISVRYHLNLLERDSLIGIKKVRGIAEGITADRQQKLAGTSVEQKIDSLVELLGAEGFLARWEQANGDILLKEYNCPYQRVRQTHPE